MKLVCVARFVPDGDWMDPFGNSHSTIPGEITIRDGCRRRLCPDDAAALGFALSLRQQIPDLSLHLLALATPAAILQIEDILRLGVDRATLLPEMIMATSDTVTLAKMVGSTLPAADYDWILTGSDTHGHAAAPLAPALAGVLGIDHLSGICRIDDTRFTKHHGELERREGRFVTRYAVRGPAILGFDARSDYAMPYLRIKDRAKDVSHRLRCPGDMIEGPEEANTQPCDAVIRLTGLMKRQKRRKNPRKVDLNDEGIAQVYHYLCEERLI
ncbi:hypothetical protein [Cohaesibacter intestini]|uniref:hypothetical protein n=1 Tax=Cohaesibacter intestini TaxID=2211145 RepID=UPI000DEACAD8|nr:hypothetical protein [Cohaesibacter intestini]